jgi:hypothetical protein
LAAPHDPEPPPRDSEASPAALPPRLIAVAYLLALLCLLVPLAAVGSVFAGIVLLRRGRTQAGAGVLALTAACTAIGIVMLTGA